VTTNDRLELEEDLLARIARGGRPRRTRRLRWPPVRWVFFLLVLAATATAIAAWVSDSLVKRTALARTINTFVTSLAANDLDRAVTVCAEGDEGARLLRDSESHAFIARTFGASPAPSALPQARSARLETLALIRAEAARAGVDWRRVRPLAFGGLEAEVFRPEEMREPVTALVGDVYLDSGGNVHALEISLRDCGGTYVIVDVYQCARVDVDPERIEQDSLERFLRFDLEPERPMRGTALRNPRHVFITL